MALTTNVRLVSNRPPPSSALESWLLEVTLSAAAPLCFVAGACLRAAELADRWILFRRSKRGDRP